MARYIDGVKLKKGPIDMYLNILKKDLKRKKTINLILLSFAILASMFVSSGLNNVITVMNGTDYFMDKAGIGDYVVITQNGDGGAEDILKKSENVNDYRKEDCFWASRDDITVNGAPVDMKNNTLVLQSLQDTGIKYYHTNNEELKNVEKGELYVTAGFLDNNNLKIGDSFRIQLHGTDRTYRIAGEIKDALLGSDMMGNTRLIISDEDFEFYKAHEELKPYSGCIFCIGSDNVKELESEVTDASNVLFSDGRNMIELCYVMEMIVAMIVLVLSVCLVIVSFVLLKFAITFSINEEYREIGIMKAIGIRNLKIRSLYITKYLLMATVGGIIGFLAGIPFGKMLIKSVSEKMILGNDLGLAINMIGAVAVIFIMSGFAYLCTGKVKKATPVDAIRSGQTGERYKKKSVCSLKKSRFSNAFFMAANDVLSAPRRFITIILSFLLCSVFVFGVVEVSDTMKSDRLITTFGKKSDVYINDTKMLELEFIMSQEGDDGLKQKYEEIEDDLKELGMPGKVSMEVWYKYPVTCNGETVSVTFQQNTETETSDYEYTRGTAPQSPDEIAITPAISERIGAKIGDRVTVDFGTEKRDCIVTAYFQTMNQLGNVIRLHEDAPTSMEYTSAIMAFQIDFDDKVSAEETDERIEELKEYYGIEGVFNAAEYCDDCMRVAGTLDAVSKLLLAITCIVVILVTVLMERSFISEETVQIALLKAMGFKNGFILRWHVYRFMIVAAVSEVLAVALTYPVTKLWCDPIWNMMGATNVDYYFKPLSLLIVYPGIILLINLFSVLVTALYTRRITGRDVMNIE